MTLAEYFAMRSLLLAEYRRYRSMRASAYDRMTFAYADRMAHECWAALQQPVTIIDASVQA